MININRFLQKSYELQQKQHEQEIQKYNSDFALKSNYADQISEESEDLKKSIQQEFEQKTKMNYSFPLKINCLQSTELQIYDPQQFTSYCSPTSQNQNLMSSCAQFTFRNQTNSQNKVQNPSIQSPQQPQQSYCENNMQNNIIMNNLMTQSLQNFSKEKKQNYMQNVQQNNIIFQVSKKDQDREEEYEENYTPISYNISSHVKCENSSKSLYFVDESAISKQQVNTQVPHYPMMERENNQNYQNVIQNQNKDQSFQSQYLNNQSIHQISSNYSPSKTSDLSCLRTENMNPQYIANNVVTQHWENPQSAILTMNNSLNIGLNLQFQKQYTIEPNTRYDNIELSQQKQQTQLDQVTGDNLASHIVKNFDSVESSISYNHSQSILSDELQDNPKKNNSLKQEIENIINSTRENTNSIPTTQFNSNQYPQEIKNDEFFQIKQFKFPYYQQELITSQYNSSQTQGQECKNFHKTQNLPVQDIALDNNQINDSDKENEEINYNYEPKSNRNYQISISTASSCEQYTHRQKQDTLRKLLSPQSHQELMSQFMGSSQTLQNLENNKQQILSIDDFFTKSKQQLDSTRNNPNGILNMINKSRDMSPLNLQSDGKKLGVNLSLTNLHSIIQSTRNTQTKQICLNYTPSNQQKNSDKKKNIPKLSININQVMDLKSSQIDSGKNSSSLNRLGQSQSTKNILQSTKSSNNLMRQKRNLNGKSTSNERDELKQLSRNNSTKNKFISINIAQVNNHSANNNFYNATSNPQLFKRINNKSLTNINQQQNTVSQVTNQSISPSRRFQIQLNTNIKQNLNKNAEITITEPSSDNYLNKQNSHSKIVTPKNYQTNQINSNQVTQNTVQSPQRDPLKQYQLVYKPLNKQNNKNNIRRSNTSRNLLNHSGSSNHFNSCLNNSKNNNNNQSSFVLDKSNELIKKSQQMVKTKTSQVNTNIGMKDANIDKFYKTNQNQIQKTVPYIGIKHIQSDRNQHKQINLSLYNKNNQSISLQKNSSSSQIPFSQYDEGNNYDLKIQEKLFESKLENTITNNIEQMKQSDIQITSDKNKQQQLNTASTPISQTQKPILQKCLHSLPQIYCNICNRKSRNNIQQLHSKR